MAGETYSPTPTKTCKSYGSIAIVDEENVQFFVPIHPLDNSLKQDTVTTTTSPTSSFITDFETDTLVSFPPYGQKSLADRFFILLGFSRNPFEYSTCNIRNSAASDMRLAMLSNFSTAYNVVSISLALDIMGKIYEATPEDKSMCSSALIAGMIVGQIIGGAIGDILGRHVAMAVVMALQVVGALISSLAVGGRFSIYLYLAGRWPLLFSCHKAIVQLFEFS